MENKNKASNTAYCKKIIEKKKQALLQLEDEGKEKELYLFIESNPMYIKFLKVQTDELCRLAVSVDPMTLQFVRVQSDEICRTAVSNNGLALKYVKVQTEEICRIAVKNNKDAATYVQLKGLKLSEIICTAEAILSIVSTIKYLKHMKSIL